MISKIVLPPDKDTKENWKRIANSLASLIATIRFVMLTITKEELGLDELPHDYQEVIVQTMRSFADTIEWGLEKFGATIVEVDQHGDN